MSVLCSGNILNNTPTQDRTKLKRPKAVLKKNEIWTKILTIQNFKLGSLFLKILLWASSVFIFVQTFN